MKGNLKRVVSGLLTAVTLMSTVVQPVGVYAAELNPEDTKPPLYEEIKDLLDADEVVTARDYEMEIGCTFDPLTDFSSIEIPDNQKVKVTFEEAMNEQEQEFTTDHADTYDAVYYVEPLTTDHPKYQISRKLIVKEPVTEVSVTETEGTTEESQDSGGGGQSEESESEDGESESHEKTLSEMSYQEILEAGAALVDEAMKSGESEIHFEGEDLELYRLYQQMLLAEKNGGIMPIADPGSLVV